jgi:Putative adhesin
MRVGTFVLILLTLTSLSAFAEDWKKTFSTSGKPTVQVDTNDAEIQVTGGDGRATEIHVISEGYRIGPNDLRITDQQNGDRIVLEVHVPRVTGLVFHNHSVRVEIAVPREADLNLHTADGDVRVESVKGELRIESNDGKVEIRGADGRVTASTHDGDIQADGRFDALDLHTGDGNIEARASSGSKIGAAWELRSGDGNVTLRLPPDTSADVDAHTGDGHVVTDFPLTVVGSVKENAIRGKMNGGGSPIELRTGDGNIKIEKI